MEKIVKIGAKICFIFASTGLLAMPAQAKVVKVKMRNYVAGSGAMVFDPPVVTILPGDTVLFQAADKGHDVVTIDSFAPPGTPAVKGKMGQDLAVKMTRPGLYGFKCTPHYSMGMVALVRVSGAPAVAPPGVVNAMPPLAKKRMLPLISKVR